ncbi:hypothetical protein AUEXF2481DRAFT_28461 [Aureobasidium subglaciale EXF-2481]|uniref:Uncharacterized protein n=1 Tax=Aureobasidium subglaciale (strain EXF-2481) TaxID=1043005 RepID=A0A074YQY4_AURSE|nr:uncharacterized protein AUEXF2481DRAFT_28461 [Aureobasidium subglaciale EXF-2481]KEQ96522.1 hypothetical protein AUEXF2481DRAFT_28461 [Aureobasidium subglaciale EXF-2481]
MPDSQLYLTATVVYDSIWTFDSAVEQTLTYTTTYVSSHGQHMGYAIVVNTALPSPSQVETIGITYSIRPDTSSTQHVSATVATHMPTATTSQSSAVMSAPCDGSSSSRSWPLSQSLAYFQFVLLCLFCGGYFWSRRMTLQQSQDDENEHGRDTCMVVEASDKKSTSDQCQSVKQP